MYLNKNQLLKRFMSYLTDTDYYVPTIAVTGAGGYVGSVMCRKLLHEGYKVKAMDNFMKGSVDALLPLAQDSDFEFFKGDVLDSDDVKKLYSGVDVVMHMAAAVGAPFCKEHKEQSRLINVEGTKRMINERPYEIPFIFFATGSQYGVVEGVCTEDTPLNYQSEYGEQKTIAEELVLEEQNSLSCRFATAFGVSPTMRVNLLVNDLTYQAVNNRKIEVFQADFKRTFIHVRDMCNAVIYLMQDFDNLKHKVFNVGDNELNWSKRQLSEYIKKKTNCKVIYNDFDSDPDVRNYEVDYSRLNSTGFSCLNDMETGIDELIRAVPMLSTFEKYR